MLEHDLAVDEVEGAVFEDASIVGEISTPTTRPK
jgi:hypothetical protein